MNLHSALASKYQGSGTIVPSPSWFVGRNPLEKLFNDRDKCEGLARYLRRLYRHPAIGTDQLFRSFLLQDILAKQAISKEKIREKFYSKLFTWKAKFVSFQVSDNDFWFSTKELQLKLYEKQICQLMKNTNKMLLGRKTLLNSTINLSDNLETFKHPSEHVHLLPKDGVLDMMNKLVEMNMIMLEADRSLYLLAREYVSMMRDVDIALNKRKALIWEVMNKTDKTISDAEDNSNLVVEAMERLTLVSKTLKSELEHFENEMMRELEKTCLLYQGKYSAAVILINNHLAIV